ncbi:hypothetical protein ACFSKL_22265 [Belliella marina]|uniref:Uncharacterized protein n=1 Tax=Belliella marina TaxID=1644146 RepID=A0ABW4VVD1_9BACT
MPKIIIVIALLMVTEEFFAQTTGINTTEPKATLDVVGIPTYTIGLFGGVLHEGAAGLADFNVSFGNSSDRFTVIAHPVF